MSSFAPPSPLVPGYKLDRYELLCPIAEGGMASVWVARLQGKHGFEKLVAVKTILPKFAADLRFQHMFLDEARIASRIEHTNVAQILDLGEEKNVLYLVMEWVDGDALSKLQRAVDEKGMKVPPGIALRILADTCGGLHAAHDLRASDGSLLGVVHRDVSPQNVLVGTRGVSKLIDFGIAKARDRAAQDTNAGALKGKIQYMAPEQATGASVDRRADIWAIGAILHHLLSGKPPFDGPNQLAALHALTLGRPAVPIPGVHPAVQAVVRRALTHDPTKRFATALEMQSAIEKAMVEAKLATTIADVAAFCAEHVGERAATRRAAIDSSLKAAQERARLAPPTSLPDLQSASGATPPPFSGKEALLTVPAVPAKRPSVSDRDAALMSEPIAETSSATLGSAGALASPVPSNGGAKTAVIVGGIVGAVTIAAAAVVAFVMMRSPAPPAPAATVAPPPPIADVPPPTPTVTATATATIAAADAAAPVASTEPSASAKTKPAFGGGAWTPPTAKPTATAPPPRRKVDPDGF